ELLAVLLVVVAAALFVGAVVPMALFATGITFIGPPLILRFVFHACTFSLVRNPALITSSGASSCGPWIEKSPDGEACGWLEERGCESAPPEKPAVVPALVSRKRMLSKRRSCWRNVVCRPETSVARKLRRSPLSLPTLKPTWLSRTTVCTSTLPKAWVRSPMCISDCATPATSRAVSTGPAVGAALGGLAARG